MAKPSLKQVVHIPFMDVSSHFEETYGFDQDEYWSDLCDDHMFRGNDSSKNFYCQFMEEIIYEYVLDKVTGLDNKIKEILLMKDEKKMLQAILKTPPRVFLNQYKFICDNKDIIEQALGKEDEYYFGYLVRGLVECAVISCYKLTDYHKSNKYYYHFSW